MGNVALYLIHSLDIVVVSLVLRHEFKVLFVYAIHLLLVVLLLAVFRLDNHLNLLADLLYFYVTILC
jgi:hypothetical protein